MWILIYLIWQGTCFWKWHSWQLGNLTIEPHALKLDQIGLERSATCLGGEKVGCHACGRHTNGQMECKDGTRILVEFAIWEIQFGSLGSFFPTILPGHLLQSSASSRSLPGLITSLILMLAGIALARVYVNSTLKAHVAQKGKKDV